MRRLFAMAGTFRQLVPTSRAVSDQAPGLLASPAPPVSRSCPVCGNPGNEIPEYRRVDLARCLGCGLIFHGGLATGLKDEYANGEYEAAHDIYFEDGRVFTHIAAQRIRWLSRWVSAGTLLELGPGGGFFLDVAREAGFDTVGVEPSPELAARAVSEFGLEVECGFLDEVELSREHFDLICLFHVFEHVDDPVGMLEQLAGLLGDDGLIAMEVPNISSAMARRRADQWAAVQPVELHVSQFTPHTLRQVVEWAGLEVVAIDTVSPWHYIPVSDRWRHRALLGYAYRAASLRTLRNTHPTGFDHLRVVARNPG
jgi:SAM-dependent methyltransferase